MTISTTSPPTTVVVDISTDRAPDDGDAQRQVVDRRNVDDPIRRGAVSGAATHSSIRPHRGRERRGCVGGARGPAAQCGAAGAAAGRRSRATTARWSVPATSCTAKSHGLRARRHEHVVDLDAEPARQRRREGAHQAPRHPSPPGRSRPTPPQRPVVERRVEVAGHDRGRVRARPAPDVGQVAQPAGGEPAVARRGGVHREQVAAAEDPAADPQVAVAQLGTGADPQAPGPRPGEHHHAHDVRHAGGRRGPAAVAHAGDERGELVAVVAAGLGQHHEVRLLPLDQRGEGAGVGAAAEDVGAQDRQRRPEPRPAAAGAAPAHPRADRDGPGGGDRPDRRGGRAGRPPRSQEGGAGRGADHRLRPPGHGGDHREPAVQPEQVGDEHGRGGRTRRTGTARAPGADETGDGASRHDITEWRSSASAGAGPCSLRLSRSSRDRGGPAQAPRSRRSRPAGRGAASSCRSSAHRGHRRSAGSAIDAAAIVWPHSVG